MRRWTQADLDQIRAHRDARRLATTPKPSKYHNVGVVIDGRNFASKKEGAYYVELKARRAAGEIRNLELQVPFLLTTRGLDGLDGVVATYVCDFQFEERDADGEWSRVVVDVKGGRATQTQLYALKKKWLWLQSGIAIREVP